LHACQQTKEAACFEVILLILRAKEATIVEA
jgi:hypothetical protein